MEQLEEQVKRIHDKLQQVLRQREALLKDNNKLKEELRQLRQSENHRAEQMEQLKRQVEILKVKKGEMPLEEKALLEKRLSQYIREIDRCIAFLAE
jgi:septal ring factor EnvC (AmiA/AmiB activator)